MFTTALVTNIQIRDERSCNITGISVMSRVLHDISMHTFIQTEYIKGRQRSHVTGSTNLSSKDYYTGGQYPLKTIL